MVKHKVLLLLGVALVLWGVFFAEAISSVIRIWYISEYYTHGFLILPITALMFWLRRGELASHGMHPNLVFVLPLVLIMILGVFAWLGQINLFSHFALFAFLPFAFGLVAGWELSKRFWFPLLFVLFSIPVGDQLLPYLQSLTAWFAISLLSWFEIPIYVNGLYIEIPNGTFHVAEECSGLRFLIACLVFCAIYGYFTFKHFSLRLFFMLLAVTVPIFANALRVFGTILVGHYFGMEYAGGVDHLVYGWVFYTFVIVLMILLGEYLRRIEVAKLSAGSGSTQFSSIENPQSADEQINPGSTNNKLVSVTLSFLVVLLLAGILWKAFVIEEFADVASRQALEHYAVEYSPITGFGDGWEPAMLGDTDRFYANTDTGVELAIFWYARDGEQSELISSVNHHYDKESWSRSSSRTLEIAVDGRDKVDVVENMIVSAKGQLRYQLVWYAIGSNIEHAAWRVKLAQTIDRMLGGAGASAMFYLTLPIEEHGDKAIIIERVQSSFKAEYKALQQMLP